VLLRVVEIERDVSLRVDDGSDAGRGVSHEI
jgi:hypothetical protein